MVSWPSAGDRNLRLIDEATAVFLKGNGLHRAIRIFLLQFRLQVRSTLFTGGVKPIFIAE